MSWTLCTSSGAIVKAGLNANSSITASSSILATWSDEAEGLINTNSRKDWVTDYASVKTNFKPILAACCSSIIAQRIINYDMSGYTSRVEAQTMLDVLENEISRDLAILREEKNKEKM